MGTVYLGIIIFGWAALMLGLWEKECKKALYKRLEQCFENLIEEYKLQTVFGGRYLSDEEEDRYLDIQRRVDLIWYEIKIIHDIICENYGLIKPKYKKRMMFLAVKEEAIKILKKENNP